MKRSECTQYEELYTHTLVLSHNNQAWCIGRCCTAGGIHLSLSLSLSPSLTDRLLLSNWPTLSLSSEHIFTLSHTHPIELTFILSIPPSLTLSCLHCHSHIVGTYRPTHKHKSKGMYQHTHSPFSVTRKDSQISIKVALKMISLGKLKILTP